MTAGRNTNGVNQQAGDQTAEIERLRSELSSLRSQLYAKDEWFVQQVVDYHNGCQEGKRDFLEHIGLQYPTRTYTLTVEIEAPDLDDVAYELKRNAENGYALTDDVDGACVLSASVD
jgi:hypothetical protein